MMYVNLLDVRDISLIPVAKYFNSIRPAGYRSEFLESAQTTDGLFVPNVITIWGLDYIANKDIFKPVDRNCSVHVYGHKGTPYADVSFQTDYIFNWERLSWWDVCRVMIAAESKSFWVDIPDDLLTDEDLKCTST